MQTRMRVELAIASSLGRKGWVVEGEREQNGHACCLGAGFTVTIKLNTTSLPSGVLTTDVAAFANADEASFPESFSELSLIHI